MTTEHRPLTPRRRTPRWRALLLLASLWSHLLMMASPMHGAQVAHAAAALPAAAASAHAEHDGMAVQAHVEASHHRHGGHCGIEWTASRPQPSATALLDLSTPVGGPTDGLPLASSSSLPAELGPPARGDSQAVLQVFRL